MYYKLNEDRNVSRCSSEDWPEFFESSDRFVKQENVEDKYVSTVFLGIDYNFSGEGEPILFETMVFRRNEEGEIDFTEVFCDRCSTWEEAENIHKETIRKLEQGEIK